MNIVNPWAFFLFIPLLLVALFVWKIGIRKRSRVYFPLGSWIDKRPRFTLPSPFKMHFVLRLMSLSLIIVALARPQEIFTKTNRIAESVDMVICFDLSKSMDAIDFKPNRRAVALKTVIEFIRKRADDRIGLVLFSGEAYLAVPVTHDHNVLIEAIEKSSNRGLSDGTAIGQSLAVATHHLKNSKAKSRVIVLVTDGDNNMGSVNPRTAAELAKGFGLKIYTIGLGKKGRVAFPVKSFDPFGNEVEVYQYLTDAVNDELLAEIALKTGGRSFRAAEDGILERIFSTIDTLEKTRVETQTLVRYSELAYPWILFAALILFLELLALNTRWRKVP
jgi:Ca-activated chloride channel family protein